MEKREINRLIEERGAEFCHLSDQIWEHPETCFEEKVSSQLLRQALEKEGFTLEENLAGIPTAFSGTFGQGGPVIGFLGEFDALSGMSQQAGVLEKMPVPGCQNGHGCGHQLLGAGALAAAVAMKRYLEETGKSGTVIYFGCPAEEGGSGKTYMARAGCFKGVDCALTWHPGNRNRVAMASTLANYQVYYRFKGLSAHAAAVPHLGRSALDAVELLNVGVQFLREHIIPEARIHYAITETGGFSPNVVQAQASVLYLIRAPRNEQVEEIYARVNKIAQGAALMTETELEVDFVKGCSNIVLNDVLAKVMYDNFKALDLPQYTQEEWELARKICATQPPAAPQIREDIGKIPGYWISPEERSALLEKADHPISDFLMPYVPDQPISALSSDVGDVSWNVPLAQCSTAAWAAGTPGHSWQIVSMGKSSIAHKGMLLAAKVMADTAIDLLERPELVRQAKEELERRLGGTPYKCPIPDHIRPRIISKQG